MRTRDCKFRETVFPKPYSEDCSTFVRQSINIPLYNIHSTTHVYSITLVKNIVNIVLEKNNDIQKLSKFEENSDFSQLFNEREFSHVNQNDSN